MSFLVLINRGPVDDRVEMILDSMLMETPEYSDWVDFPQECVPARVLKSAKDTLSEFIVNTLHEGMMHIDIVIQTACHWFDSIGYLAKYLHLQLMRIGINPRLVTYVDIQPNAIQLTLEC